MLVLLSSLLAPLHGQADALYTVTMLPAGFNPSGINNAGQMSGDIYLENGAHAALYSGGIVTDLGTFGGNASYGRAINDAGAVTGTAESLSGWGSAFLYRNGSMTDIGAGTSGFGINARGDVVGQKYNVDGTRTAFLYRDGALIDLGNLGTGTVALAHDINDAGQVVGESDISPEFHAPFHPFLYSDGSMRDLGTLAGFENNSAVAINNAGLVAGYSTATDSTLHAFVYRDGVMRDAGNFGGSEIAIGGINEAGVFVGTAETQTGQVGFAWLDGALVDLNTLIDPALGWTIDAAVGINDLGQIAAHGCREWECGALRLDLANAVPEPAGFLLLLPGLCAIVCLRRVKRSSAQAAVARRAPGNAVPAQQQ